VSLVTDSFVPSRSNTVIEFPLRYRGGKEVAMQLHLETDKLNFLANLLMEPARETAGSPLDDRLLEMVLARDPRFDSDDLERLTALLVAAKGRMKDDVLHETSPVRRFELKCRLALLEKVLEKVDEACAMI
jgi:hypothetical protein